MSRNTQGAGEQDLLAEGERLVGLRIARGVSHQNLVLRRERGVTVSVSQPHTKATKLLTEEYNDDD